MTTRPFRRPPFAALPQRPPRPHDFLALPERSVRVRVAGERLRVAYRERGEGPPLLLVHGLMTSGYSWRHVMAPLSALGFRVLAPDLPGAGGSEAPVKPCTADRLTEAIGAFQDALGIAGCAAVGNSMGGYLCMRLALREPERFPRLVNVHSPAVPLLRLRALRAALASPVARALVRAAVARDPERWVFRNVHYYDESLKSREELEVYAAPLKTPKGRRAFVSWLRDGLDPGELARFMDELVELRRAQRPFPTPLLLLYAREDPMVPPSVGCALGRLLPDAEQVWLARSSHFAHVDTPELFVDAVTPFLRAEG